MAGYIPRRLVDRGCKKLILGGLDKFLVIGDLCQGDAEVPFFIGIIGDDKIPALLMPVRAIFVNYPVLSIFFHFFENFFAPKNPVSYFESLALLFAIS